MPNGCFEPLEVYGGFIGYLGAIELLLGPLLTHLEAFVHSTVHLVFGTDRLDHRRGDFCDIEEVCNFYKRAQQVRRVALRE